MPEPEKSAQLLFQSPAAADALKIKHLIIHQGMVNESVQRAVLAGKITVKRLSGNIHLLAQVADGDIFIPGIAHDLHQSLFHLPLTGSRLFGSALLVHQIPILSSLL